MFKLLIVDDEVAIQSSIARLFAMSNDVEVHTASSAKEAMGIMANHQFDVVVSDERMPEINGTDFLFWVKEHHRHVQRIILTGYADQEATIRAINKAEVYRYLQKPWDSQDLLATIRGAFQLKEIQDRNRQLEAKIREHNKELEKVVAERTRQLQRSLGILKQQHELLKGQHSGLAELLLAIVGHFEPDKSQIAHYISNVWLSVVQAHGLSVRADSNYIAALSVIIISHGTSFTGLMSTIEGFEESARLIQLSMERWDGKGLLGFKGADIPLESRLMRIIRDYYSLYPQALSLSRHILTHQSGIIYDPELVPRFLETAQQVLPEETVTSNVALADLVPGMILAQDLQMANGSVLLHKETVLLEQSITQLGRLGNYLDKGVAILSSRVRE
jgi:response regulator RpfG family c-di-GMP phosphodiesterase